MLIVTSSCEHTAKPDATSVASATQICIDTSRLQPTAAKEDSGFVNVDYKSSMRAHMDSLSNLASVLARADTTVEGEEFKRGDLDGDGSVDDYLVLAQGKRPCEIVNGETYCRVVFIMLNDNRAGLRVAAANTSIVSNATHYESYVNDSFHHFSIGRHTFSITNLEGSCDKTETVITFRYNSALKDWMLQARDTWDYSCQENGIDKKVHESTRNFGRVRFANAVAYH